MGKKIDVVKINSLTEVIIDRKLELEHVFWPTLCVHDNEFFFHKKYLIGE
jgi:hypothetical protein